MLASPSSAIDLPLKILVWEDGEGKIWVSYNSPAYLMQRHGFPAELLKNIAAVEAIATAAAEDKNLGMSTVPNFRRPFVDKVKIDLFFLHLVIRVAWQQFDELF